MKQQQPLSSVTNALHILNCFTINQPERRVKDIANELSISESAASRILATLAKEKFVAKNPETKKYRLSTAILRLNTVISSTTYLTKEATPIMQKFVEATGELIHLSKLEDDKVVYIYELQGKQPVMIQSQIGIHTPAHCTSSGKILLAFHEEKINKILEKELKKFAKNTITDPHELREQLRKAKTTGFAIGIEEYLDGIVSISAPIFNYEGDCIAALTTVGPIQRFTEQTIPRFTTLISKCAKEISISLGYDEIRQT